MKSASRTRVAKRSKAVAARPVQKPVRTQQSLDPQFLAAAKASRKKFGALFKRLAKT
ncbi:hypothetical protein [Hyphomicrobium sp.]|uniref:hypothetical protein n=1 Tax=Hyphomicrobium sp. TaxID=82 RepID=UPI0025C369BB|nr:hypothetical protein [Hyphomicrobium sp.]